MEVKAADGVHELKIDAGNGTVLAQDSQHEDGADNDKGDSEHDKGSSATDNDQVQVEDQSGD